MSKYESLKLENQLCFPLYAAARKVVNLYNPFLKDLGLTYTQYIAMMVIWEEDGINVKCLGERLFLDSGTLTPLLKNLEKKGYITRSRLKEDERVTIVKLTDEGRSLRDAALDVPKEMSSCIKLDPDEAVKLYKMLYKLIGEK